MSAPKQYRKKPVVIEAMQVTNTSAGDVAAWCGGRLRYEAKPSDRGDVAEWIDIPTLEGVIRANRGDYVIRGVKGEFYLCKPDIFDATYDPAPEDSP